MWVDDSFMGTAVAVEWAGLGGGAEQLEWAGQQILGLATRLASGGAPLPVHGYHHQTGRKSCCVWGRGAGWAVTAVTSFLTRAEELGLQSSTVERVRLLQRDWTETLLVTQVTTGLHGDRSNVNVL